MPATCSSAAEPAFDSPLDPSRWGEASNLGSQRSNMAAVLHGVHDLRFEQAPPLPDRCGSPPFEDRCQFRTCLEPANALHSVCWLCFFLPSLRLTMTAAVHGGP